MSDSKAGSSSGDDAKKKEALNSGATKKSPGASASPEGDSASPSKANAQTQLQELALLYCIRAEAANLRFMPE